MNKCIDCGDAPINHTLEWVSVVLEKVLAPKQIPFEGIWRMLEAHVTSPLLNAALPIFMRACVAVGLARFVDAPDQQTHGRARVMWEEALRRGIRVREFRLFGISSESFIATYGGTSKTFIGLPRPGDVSSPGLSWMGDKELLRERLVAKGIPTARGGVAVSVASAKSVFARLRPPVVTKPELGSRSRHTTTHIYTEAELISAFKKAAVLSPWVVIEEEERGFVYRGTVVGGKLVAVLRREPPLVVGDGAHTVTELIAIENANPRRDGTIFHAIELDDEAQAELARQQVAPDFIPALGRQITLSQKASRGIGGRTVDVTNIIHSDNRQMLEDAAAVVGDPLMGTDFIIPDITRSWKEQPRSGIIECNSLPFIDLHHYPLVGESRNVAGALWDIVYPMSRSSAEDRP